MMFDQMPTNKFGDLPGSALLELGVSKDGLALVTDGERVCSLLGNWLGSSMATSCDDWLKQPDGLVGVPTARGEVDSEEEDDHTSSTSSSDSLHASSPRSISGSVSQSDSGQEDSFLTPSLNFSDDSLSPDFSPSTVDFDGLDHLHLPDVDEQENQDWPLVLVTGANGYIGSHVVLELLRQAKFGVVAVDSLANSNLECLRRVQQLSVGENACERPVRSSDSEPRRRKHKIPPTYFHQIDIRDQQKLEEVFDLYRRKNGGGKTESLIQHVIHFAALKSVRRSKDEPELYFDTNVIGTKVLMDAMERSKVSSLVFSSSAVVYGNRIGSEDESLSEFLQETDCWVSAHQSEQDRRLNDERITNPYGKTKLRCEEMIHERCFLSQSTNGRPRPLRAVILRYTNPTGNDPSGMIGDSPIEPENLMSIAAQVLQGRRKNISIFGTDYRTRDGTGIRDFIHVQDLARGHLLALDLTERNQNDRLDENYPNNCKTYNLGTGRGATVMEVMKALMEASGKKIEMQVGARRDGDLAVVVCDPSKSERELGWTAKKTIQDMACDLWRFCQMNPDGLRKC